MKQLDIDEESRIDRRTKESNYGNHEPLMSEGLEEETKDEGGWSEEGEKNEASETDIQKRDKSSDHRISPMREFPVSRIENKPLKSESRRRKRTRKTRNERITRSDRAKDSEENRIF